MEGRSCGPKSGNGGAASEAIPALLADRPALHAGCGLRPQIPCCREKSREFAIFPAILAFLDVDSCCNSRVFYVNSLPIGAGNV